MSDFSASYTIWRICFGVIFLLDNENENEMYALFELRLKGIVNQKRISL